MNSTAGTNCFKCGGLIMEPGKPYSYSGPVCHCIYQPQYIIPQSHPINYPSYNPPTCECHSCTQARRNPLERGLESQLIKQTVFTADDFRDISNKIYKEGYRSWSAGDMWEPEFGPEDIAKVANEKIKTKT